MRALSGAPRIDGRVLVAAALMATFLAAGCGKKSDDRSGAKDIASDLDSLAFQPESLQVRADVDSGNAQFIRAWMTGSGDLLANCYVNDGARHMYGGKVIEGRDSITAQMGRVFARERMRRGTLRTTGLRIQGDQASETGQFYFEIGPVSGGRAQVRAGAYEQLWKYESGQWKMWRDVKPRG